MLNSFFYRKGKSFWQSTLFLNKTDVFIVHVRSEKALEEMQMKLDGNYFKYNGIEQGDLFEWERILNWEIFEEKFNAWRN